MNKLFLIFLISISFGSQGVAQECSSFFSEINSDLIVTLQGIENLRKKYFQSDAHFSYLTGVQTLLIHLPGMNISFEKSRVLALQLLDKNNQNVSAMDIIKP